AGRSPQGAPQAGEGGAGGAVGDPEGKELLGRPPGEGGVLEAELDEAEPERAGVGAVCDEEGSRAVAQRQKPEVFARQGVGAKEGGGGGSLGEACPQRPHRRRWTVP